MPSGYIEPVPSNCGKPEMPETFLTVLQNSLLLGLQEKGLVDAVEMEERFFQEDPLE